MVESIVYTEKADCRDCYRCIRECVSKAIDVADGHAQIRQERCVLCGHCVSVCPVGAKRVRSDLVRAQSLLLRKKQVYVSLAPSFVAEYSDASPYAVSAGLVRLGFAGVSETALGAEAVTAYEAARGADAAPLTISSACPAVVELVRKYYPHLLGSLSDALSPALTHARMLREWYGEEIGVVFVSPCIAKKREADEHPDLIDVAITFEDLSTWFEQANVDVRYLDDWGASFVPHRARDGRRYPVEGGMIAGLRSGRGYRAESVSGLDHVREVLDEVSSDPQERPLFLELLACEGGCINGPRGRGRAGRLRRSESIGRWFAASPEPATSATEPRFAGLDHPRHDLVAAPVATTHHEDAEIHAALAMIGKHRRTDELNCGSCGYGSCREFAHALLDRRAERTMCVGHMRKIAQKKADALIRAMPSGVVIVGGDLLIRESNAQFARLAGEEAELLFDAKPGLEGISIGEIVPFWDRFADVLNGATDLLGEDFEHEGRVLSGSIFIVEQGTMVGGIFQDVTVPSVRRDRVINQAEEVIRRNLSTVQQIAHLLGENAAETESLLHSVITAFGSSETGS